MERRSGLGLMARYNEWMNTKLYAAAAQLSTAALEEDRKAFFGSIWGTLNHLMVADTLWLKRFAAHPTAYAALEPVLALPAPTRLDEQVCANLAELTERRKLLDQIILDWTASIAEADLDTVLAYTTTRGVALRHAFYGALLHFFNHQTHHRGQLSTLLTQAGVDVGATDLLLLVRKDDAL